MTLNSDIEGPQWSPVPSRTAVAIELLDFLDWLHAPSIFSKETDPDPVESKQALQMAKANIHDEQEHTVFPCKS